MTYYVVWLGKTNGIYESWKDCQKEIEGYRGAIYKKFNTLNESVKALSEHPKNYVKLNTSHFTVNLLEKNKQIAKKYELKTTKKNIKVNDSNKRITNKKQKQQKSKPANFEKMIGLNLSNVICIDGSCVIDEKVSYSFGKIEYQGVFLEGNKKIFNSKVYPKGTNNIAEFLAIVEALKYVQENNIKNAIIYTDSLTAMNWVSKKTYNTNLELDNQTELLYEDLENAKKYLETHDIVCPVLKWQTTIWGENPADFGRK